MIAAFVPARALLGGWLGLQPLVMIAMYLVGVVVAIPDRVAATQDADRWSGERIRAGVAEL